MTLKSTIGGTPHDNAAQGEAKMCGGNLVV